MSWSYRDFANNQSLDDIPEPFRRYCRADGEQVQDTVEIRPEAAEPEPSAGAAEDQKAAEDCGDLLFMILVFMFFAR